MILLTADQITEIADALVALGEELQNRNWEPDAGVAVLGSAAGTIVGHALMRAPVPQQACFAPPPYPYGPEDFSQNTGTALQLTVTGHTKAELEESARQLGEGFFGADADLVVTLTTPAGGGQVLRAGDPPVYSCGAHVRVREPLG